MNNKISIIACTGALSLFMSFAVFSEESKAKEKVVDKKYTMCAAVRMKEVNLDHLKKNAEKYSTAIPDGWTVVGGTGGEGHPKLLLCR